MFQVLHLALENDVTKARVEGRAKPRGVTLVVSISAFSLVFAGFYTKELINSIFSSFPSHPSDIIVSQKTSK